MKPLSKATEKVVVSPIRTLFHKSIGMTDLASFTLGEPDFLTPQHIVDAGIKALQEGKHKYTANSGIIELREAISNAMKESHGMKYSPESEVIVTTGGTGALFLTMETLLDPGDEFIISDPCWPNYFGMLHQMNAVPVPVPVDISTNFSYDPEKLEAAITEKTKAFIVNSPSNPTGGLATRENLEQLAKIAMKHDLYVISDEVYGRLLYDGNECFSIATLPGMKERTIVVNSFSKTYAMTGWRVGWAAGPKEIIENMEKFQENMVSCVNAAAQYGAIAALTAPQTAVEEMVASYAKRRDMVVHEFRSIPGLDCFIPQGAFYAFVDVSGSGKSATVFCDELLEQEQCIVVPGHSFGKDSDRYIRICFATSEENIRKGTARIRRYMNRVMAEKEK